MISYYAILEVERNATAADIKKAYKRLALKYHPDKNGGNKQYEDVFKLINEAYQVLSDTELRRKHDLAIDYAISTSAYKTPAPPKEEKTVYNRYGRYDWRNAPRYKKASVYKIDKNYYRNIVISFVAILVFALLTVAGVKFNNYLNEQEEKQREERFNQLVAEAQKLFDQGQFRESLHLIEELNTQFPSEYIFFKKKETLIQDLNKLAISNYQQQAYLLAVERFEILKDYQQPVRMTNWKLMAECYTQLNDLENAARIYEFIIERDVNNIDLMLKVAKIYKGLGRNDKMLDYYNEARYTFKKFQKYAYGPAFEFIIDPKEVPEEYFEMFKTRAELMLAEGDFKEAVKDCNWAIFLRPERPEIYYLRAFAHYQLGESNRICNDIKRALSRGYSKNSIKIDYNCE